VQISEAAVIQLTSMGNSVLTVIMEVMRLLFTVISIGLIAVLCTSLNDYNFKSIVFP
jgi:hypothetical protein